MATVNGTIGNDLISTTFVDADGDSVSDADDTVFGDPGDDTILGLGGNDILLGDADNDVLAGGLGDDELYGGLGNDTLVGHLGADLLNGGAGIDTASYIFSQGAVFVSLAAGIGTGDHAQGDTLTDIENLLGSTFNDTLVGDDSVNVLQGRAGDDVIEGRGGADSIDGGEGRDALSFANSPFGVSVNLLTGTISEGDTAVNMEDLRGSGFADTLRGNNEDNIVVGLEGNDVLRGELGNDLLAGLDGADWLDGGGGADALNGGDGNDTLFGAKGNDTLNGGADMDLIRGGRGKDQLFGGIERDLFDFNSIKDSLKGSKRDVINDFKRGNNVTGDDIDLRTIDAKTGVSGNQKFKFIGKQDFHDVKGELRYEDKGSKVIVQGDVNGDGKADFEIFVKVGALAKGDFLL